MKESFRVRWEAADGYAGGSRPHYFKIEAEDLEAEMTDDDLETLFYERLQEQFNDRVSAETDDFDKFIEWAKEQKAKVKR